MEGIEEDDDDDMDFVEVQVYHFDVAKGTWTDMGVGHISIKNDGPVPVLSVIADDCTPIVNEPITTDINYGMQGDCGITFWSKVDDVAKALSFDCQSQCSKFNTLLFNVSQSAIAPCPDTITCSELTSVLQVVKGMTCASVVAAWALRGNVLQKLCSLFHALGLANPALDPVAHSCILRIYDIVMIIIRTTDQKLLSRFTVDTGLWMHFLMLFDYHNSTQSLGIPDPPDDTFPTLDIPDDLHQTLDPPWTHPDLRFTHTNEFLSGCSTKMKQIADFENSEVITKVRQTVRAEYWVDCIIIPGNANSAPIPSVQPFAVSGGGAWEGTVLALREMVRNNQISITTYVAKDTRFLDMLFSNKTSECDRLRFLVELFQFAEAAFASGVDVCNELAPHGLFASLYAQLGADDGLSVIRAKLLESSVGAGPRPCTNGAVFKANLLTGGKSTTPDKAGYDKDCALLMKITKLCFSKGPSVPDDVEHMFEVIAKLLQGLHKRPTEQETGITVSPVDCEVAQMVIERALPVFYEKLPEAGAETCYKVLSMIGQLLERDNCDSTDQERVWRTSIRKQLSASLIGSNALLPERGCIPGVLLDKAEYPHIVVAVLRIHRCILYIEEKDHVEYYAAEHVLGPVLELYGKVSERGMVFSGLLGVLDLVKRIPKLMESTYKRHCATLFSEKNMSRTRLLREIKDLIPKELENQLAVTVAADIDEIQKAYSALMDIEEVRVQLIAHYKALCQAASMEPQVPNLVVMHAELFAPHQYSEVYAKVRALRNTSPSRKSSSASFASRRDSLVLVSEENDQNKMKRKSLHRRSSADAFLYTPQPPRRRSSTLAPPTSRVKNRASNS